MKTRMNESKTLIEHFTCDCARKFNDRKFKF